MLQHDRTEYNDGYPRVFHVCTNSSSAYSDLVAKYGGDNVFKSDNLGAIQKAHNVCQSGRGDLVRIWPGTYTDDGAADATAVTVSKSHITFEGATRNAADVVIAAGADCEMFSLAATADGTKFRHLSLSLDTSATTPQDGIEVISGCAGVVVEDCIFIGADKATVAIDSEGDRLVVRRCRFEDVVAAIQSNGNYCVFDDNFFNSDNTGATAIDLTAGLWCEIKNNYFDLSGGTGDTCINVAAASRLNRISDNVWHASAAANFNLNSTGTASFARNCITGIDGSTLWETTAT